MSNGNGVAVALKVILAAQTAIIGTFLFNWLTLANSVVTEEELATELEHIQYPYFTAEAGEWRATTVSAIHQLQEHASSATVHMPLDVKDARYVQHTEIDPVIRSLQKSVDDLKIEVRALRAAIE